jgi:hypothetical protein
MINISPALLKDLQNILTRYGYKLISGHINQVQGNHRYIFTDETIKLLIEITDFKK